MENPHVNQHWHASFLRLPCKAKQLVMATADMVFLTFSLWAVFARLGFYRAVIRFVNLRLMATVAIGVLIVVAGAFIFRAIVSIQHPTINFPYLRSFRLAVHRWITSTGALLLSLDYQ